MIASEMMKKMISNKNSRRLIVLLMLFVLIFTMAACGNKNEAGEDASGGTGNAAMDEVLLKAVENLKDVSSLSYDMEMDMSMEVMGTAFDTLMSMDCKQIMSPVKMEILGTVDMGTMGKMDMMVYAEEENGGLTMYTGMVDEAQGTSWLKQSVEVNSQQIAQYDAANSIELYASSASSIKEAGTEDVDGVKATRFDGIISGDDISKVVEQSGVESQVGIDGPAELFKDSGNIPFSFWVDVEKEQIIKYEIDMTEVLKVALERAVENEEEGMAGMIGIKKMNTSVKIKGVNDVEDIVIPEEAKANATEITG